MEVTNSADSQASSKASRQKDVLVRCNAELVHYDSFWFQYPMVTAELIEEIHSMDVRPDDILVASFPKSGTTWTQEVVWQILKQNGVPLTHAESGLEHRFPMLEFRAPNFVTPTPSDLAKRAGPRLMKTHLPYQLIPDGFTRGIGKIVYVIREPKDVCTSFYYFYHSLAPLQFSGSFEEFVDAFIDGEVLFGPWIDHVTCFVQQRNKFNVLLITYEQLQHDGLNTVKKIAHFLGASLTEDQVTAVCQQCSFLSMKKNPLVNQETFIKAGFFRQTFMRKGVVGDWVNHFTLDKAAAFDKVFEQRLQQLEIQFTC